MATTRVGIAPMKTAQISKPGGDFEIVDREIPKPTAGHVLIKVQACGVCHSDSFTKEGSWPGIQYPRVPGHEIAGVIDEAPDTTEARPQQGRPVHGRAHGLVAPPAERRPEALPDIAALLPAC